jgi:hypothetical protein
MLGQNAQIAPERLKATERLPLLDLRAGVPGASLPPQRSCKEARLDMRDDLRLLRGFDLAFGSNDHLLSRTLRINELNLAITLLDIVKGGNSQDFEGYRRRSKVRIVANLNTLPGLAQGHAHPALFGEVLDQKDQRLSGSLWTGS